MARQATNALWCTLVACVLGALPAPAVTQESSRAGPAGTRAQQDRVRALEEVVSTQQARIRTLEERTRTTASAVALAGAAEQRARAAEAEAADERRRADAIIGHANQRVVDATADAERRIRQTSADLEQLRYQYDREVAGLQRLVEETAARVGAAERERWLWAAGALLLGVAGGIGGVRLWAARRRTAERAHVEPAIEQPDLFAGTGTT